MKRFITLCITLIISLSGGCLTTCEAMVEPEPAVKYSIRQVIEPTPVPLEEEQEEVEEPVIIEYPEATYIWNYLKDLGYNDYVCAGILGNIMVEVGGKTLNLQVTAENSKHYGMCQWNKKYYSAIIGASLDVQCDYLRDTIQYELNTFGSNGYNYDKFIQIQNEKTAALIFAKSYERCAAGGYQGRQDCATIAYNYFVGF